jgi:PAS domain S-box-containing protein
MTDSKQQLPVLVVAPYGRDAHLIVTTLQQAQIPCEVCRTAREALPKLPNGAGAILLEEEALDGQLIHEFANTLQQQPAWSDAPVIVLTRPQSADGKSSKLRARMRQPLGHTTLLERPVRPETLVSTVETVLRARQRQFQIRDALEQLQASEARYRSLTLATSSIVWTTDVHGRIVDRLPSWEGFTGQSFEQYRETGWMEAIHGDDRKTAEAAISAAIAGLRPYQLEYRLRRHDGRFRWVLARGVPVFREDSSVKEWVGTCSDIQDRKDSEVALRKSERMALAGQMAAGIAHEINNPLEAVTNLLYLIHMRASDDESRHYCGLAQRELTRVSEISGQTLSFYRKSNKPIATDIAELLESLLQMFRPKFGRRHLKMQWDLQQAGSVLAFPNELRQLFANLISNAIDATPPGGRIRIESRSRIEVGDRRRSGTRILVGDTGSGIVPSIRQRIFEPFVTTKGDAGTGLGLWVCDDIVKRHGGRLRLKSRTGERSGTVFSIFLPSDHSPTPQSSEALSATDAAAREIA